MGCNNYNPDIDGTCDAEIESLRTKLAAKDKQIAEVQAREKRKDEALGDACEKISNEYCAHLSGCGASNDMCYAQEQHEALSLPKDSSELDRMLAKERAEGMRELREVLELARPLMEASQRQVIGEVKVDCSDFFEALEKALAKTEEE